jgi:hypothetical protein
MTPLHERLTGLRAGLPRLDEVLALGGGEPLAAWGKVVDTRLLARFDPDFPLVAAVCGGGSSGKSTLFNTLLEARVSPTGGRAGMNRRVLISIPAAFEARAGFIAALVAPFDAPAAPLAHPDELLAPGGPLTRVHRAPRDLILLDTPDFDTGARGRYENRPHAQAALEAADILIYIFTNSNYNNRDNTDFIARMLTGIGRRKCFLVYRAYASFPDEEVAAHAMTVARHIYGAEAERHVLGIYRADEDNRVAAGERPMALAAVPAGGPPLAAALAALEVGRLRLELNRTMVADVMQTAGAHLMRGRESLAALERYGQALRAAQGACLQEALRFFPAERVLRRFAKIWAQTDPPAVKFMRRTGALVELPLKAVLGAAGWARGRLGGPAPAPDAAALFERKLEENLAAAAATLYQSVLSPQVAAPAGAPVPAHPAARDARERLRRREAGSVLQAVLARRPEIGRIGEEVDEELRAIADRFRRSMGLWAKVSQTFWAFLNVLPATLAVTYVISTGDPVGAATIKVKLAGLFGLKDLYALVAIPITRGMKQADQKQLGEMLGPLVRAWLDHKSELVRGVFEREISGEVLAAIDRAAAEARELLDGLEPLAAGEGR